MTTAAPIDQLVHHRIIIELNIPSYRLEQAKSNVDGLEKPHKEERQNTQDDAGQLPPSHEDA